MKTTNWKTTTAFISFVIAFLYAVYKENVLLVEATGTVVLVSWIILKASSETFNDIIKNISNALSERLKK